MIGLIIDRRSLRKLIPDRQVKNPAFAGVFTQP
jgi:hypothetical protein